MKQFLLVLLILGTLSSYAHKAKFVVDSNSVHGKVRVIEEYIGDEINRECSKLVMEQKGNKFSISFPFVIYVHEPRELYSNVLSESLPLCIELGNGNVLHIALKQATDITWHYWRHFPTGGAGRRSGTTVAPKYYYIYKDKPPAVLYRLGIDWKNDMNAICWMTHFDFTRDDIVEMSRSRIANIYIARGVNKISLPISPKQAKNIEYALRKLLS